MQHTTQRIRTAAIALAGALSIWACSDKSPTQAKGPSGKVQLTINNATGSAVMLDQRTASLKVGYGTMIEARVVDDAGNTIAGARPTWSSNNTTVARVTALPDSGFANDGSRASVGAFAVGTVKIIASYEGSADSATFTIEPGSYTPPPGPYVRPTQFSLTARAVGLTGGPDSTKWVFTPVPGTTVAFVQLPGVPGDTIPPAVTPVTMPTLLQTKTVDANGVVTFTNMPSARFRLEVVTPGASVWASKTFEYFAPYWDTMSLDLFLAKK